MDEEALKKARELIKNRPLGGPLFGEYRDTTNCGEDEELGERQ